MGLSQGGGQISNVYLQGSVNFGANMGGIAGVVNNGGTLINVHTNIIFAAADSNQANVGGLVGSTYPNLKISQSSANVNIQGGYAVGGLIGQNGGGIRLQTVFLLGQLQEAWRMVEVWL